MRFLRSTGVVTTLVAGGMVFVSVGGCGSSSTAKATPSKMAAGGGNPEAVRKSLMENPDARVGVVLATMPEKQFAAVGQIPVEDFHPGDTVTFVDGNGTQIATGQVVSIGKTLAVKYDATGGRAPGLGDLGVRIVNGGAAAMPHDAAATPAPATPAPETPAPATPAPETPAPATPAPETPAPATPAPEKPADPAAPAPEKPADPAAAPAPAPADPAAPAPPAPADPAATPAPAPAAPADAAPAPAAPADAAPAAKDPAAPAPAPADAPAPAPADAPAPAPADANK